MRKLLIVFILCLMLLFAERSITQSRYSPAVNLHALTLIELPNILHSFTISQTGQVINTISFPLRIPVNNTTLISSTMYQSNPIGLLLLYRNNVSQKVGMMDVRFNFGQTTPPSQKNVPINRLQGILAIPNNNFLADSYYMYLMRTANSSIYSLAATKFNLATRNFSQNRIMIPGTITNTITARGGNQEGSATWYFQRQTTSDLKMTVQMADGSITVEDLYPILTISGDISNYRDGSMIMELGGPSQVFPGISKRSTANIGIFTQVIREQSGTLLFQPPKQIAKLQTDRTSELFYQSTAIDPSGKFATFLINNNGSCKVHFQMLNPSGGKVGPRRELFSDPGICRLLDIFQGEFQ
jgi:hypothetical protein